MNTFSGAPRAAAMVNWWGYSSTPPAKGSEAEPNPSALGVRCPNLCAQQGSSLQPPRGGLCALPQVCVGMVRDELICPEEPKGFQQIWKVFSACLKAVFAG